MSSRDEVNDAHHPDQQGVHRRDEPNADKSSPGASANARGDHDPSDPFQTLVPEGEYSVIYQAHDYGVAYGESRYFVRFQIVEPIEYLGLTILRYVNEPKSWRGKKTNDKTHALGRSSTLWQDFVAVTGQRPPNHKLSLKRLYKDAQLLVKVVTVKKQNIEGKRVTTPESVHYSKIDRIIRQEAGPNGSRH